MKQNGHFLSVSRSLYVVGDLVSVATETDEGILTDLGYITGVEVDPPNTRDGGWWYAVRIIGGRFDGITDWLPQDDIVGRVIHGGFGYAK